MYAFTFTLIRLATWLSGKDYRKNMIIIRTILTIIAHLKEGVRIIHMN